MWTLHMDLSHFPIVCSRVEPTSGPGATLAEACDCYTTELRRHRGLFVGVLDFRDADGLTHDQRRLIFERVVRSAALSHRCLGHSIVVESALVRGSVTALSWLHKAPYPVRVTSLFDNAMAWADQLLQPSDRDDRDDRAERDQLPL